MNFALFSATVAIVCVGAALAFQAPVNAALAKGIGDPVWAAAISFGVGFLLLGGIAVSRGSGPSLIQIQTLPMWALTGGALGAIWVLAAIWSVPKLGVVTMFSAMILGQMIAALIIDTGGLLGLNPRELSITRVAAVGCVAIGVALSYQ